MSGGPVAYTDGACSGNPGPGGWGVRLLYANRDVRELGGMAAATTNNRMELQAAIEALKALSQHPLVTICTDSRYVIDGLTKWLPTWHQRGWLTTNNEPVKNRDLWITIEALHHPGVIWCHVRGHAGDPQNERVDIIARTFATGASPTLFCGKGGTPEDPVRLTRSTPAPATETQSASPAGTHTPTSVWYVSLVQGVVALDDTWEACAARVHGVSGVRYQKVRTPEELTAFCAKHGVECPPAMRFDK